MPRTLDIYILKELAIPFILSSGILSITLLLSKSLKLIELIVNHGVSIIVVLKFLFFLMPPFLIYIIPISFLLSVLITFNRFSGDSEITAIKASGVGLYRLSAPVAVMAIITSLLSAYITLFAFPWANLSGKKLLYDVARTKAATGIKEKTFNDIFDRILIYVNHISQSNGDLNGIMVSEERQDETSNVIIANRGVLMTNPQSMSVTLRMMDGTVHKTIKKTNKYTLLMFNTYDINLRVKTSDNPSVSRTNRELTIGELLQKIDKTKASGENASPYIIDMHKRFALPSAIFIFGLMGIPLAIQHVRTSRYRGFIIALAVMLIYYTLSTLLESLGEEGRINPFFAVWGSNIIMGIIGIYIFYKAHKESRVKWLDNFQGFLASVIYRAKEFLQRKAG